MIAHYFTLKALAEDWSLRFKDAVLGDAFTQHKDELILGIGTPHQDHMLRIEAQPSFFCVFRSDGFSRARRNTMTMFSRVIGQKILGVRVADRDRFLFLDFANGCSLQMRLFGPYANVYLVQEDGQVLEAFKSNAAWAGKPAPVSRPAQSFDTFEAFETQWQQTAHSKTWVQQLRRTVPFLDETLAEEVLFQVGVSFGEAPNLKHLFEVSQTILTHLAVPSPCIYWKEERPFAFSLLPLLHLRDLREERFATVDEAVQVYIRKRLGWQAFLKAFIPLEKALRQAHHQLSHQTEQMAEELSKPSRADRYEKWGHLLMAAAPKILPQTETVQVPDLFSEGELLAIPLDPLRSAVENAQVYYTKARKTRQAREVAEQRWTESLDLHETAQTLLDALFSLQTASEVEKFRVEQAAALGKLLGHQAMGTAVKPFRRFEVQGYEVWVGRNARENDVLTFQYARKHDLWLHARGAAGAHVVLRRTSKTQVPPKTVLETAAEIAAYFSQAKTSTLAPVQLTERKFVRKLKNGAPGQVIVEREQVLLVAPQLPALAQDG